MSQFVAFTVDGLSFALPLDCVLQSVRAVAMRPLPQAPPIVCGIINLQGRIIPVVNLRRRCGLPERPPTPDDQLLIVRSARRTLALVVDATSGVVDCEDKDFIAIATVVAGTAGLTGIVKHPDGLILIHDLDSFLSLADEQSLAAALAA